MVGSGFHESLQDKSGCAGIRSVDPAAAASFVVLKMGQVGCDLDFVHELLKKCLLGGEGAFSMEQGLEQKGLPEKGKAVSFFKELFGIGRFRPAEQREYVKGISFCRGQDALRIGIIPKVDVSPHQIFQIGGCAV